MTAPVTTKPTTDKRIPAVLAKQSILKDFVNRYLETFDKISEYNAEVLAEKSSEWNAVSVLAKAREFGSNDDASKIDQDVKAALDAWEKLVGEAAKARKAVLDITSYKLGIKLTATTERNSETEAPLKDERKLAIEIGTQLKVIAKLTTDEAAGSAVDAFLDEHPMPAIGRDQAKSFGDDGKATPKYRVTVVVKKGDEELLNEKGFTKASQYLTNPVFGYERGKAPKSDDLRKAWEGAGNTSESTVTPVVEFDDNGLHFVISKN